MTIYNEANIKTNRRMNEQGDSRSRMVSLMVSLKLWPKLYLCICVLVFVYLNVRHLGTLFLRSSYHYLFKNIAHVRSICNFDRSCICVFVYLCICICVFARQTPGNIVFEVLVSLPFRKYMVCMVQNLAQWRKDEMSRLWHTDWLTDWHTDRHRKVEQYSAEAESAIIYLREGWP